MKDAFTISLSVLAFIVSLYGVWEKRRETRRGLAVRLSQLVDELNELTYEHDKIGYEYRAAGKAQSPGLNAIANGRREVLCNEALEIANLLPGGAKPSQKRVIAANLGRFGQEQLAVALYREVLEASPASLEGMYSARGLAWTLMDMGRLDEGRRVFEEAVSLAQRYATHPDWEAGDTYVRWAGREVEVGDLGLADARLKDAEEHAMKLSHRGRREELLRRIRGVRADTMSQAKGSVQEIG
jgi:tetratricopeptide (TPR) repeat protein